ncbi:VanZ family protein [Curtobacterium sp. YC1]|nr:VanZ family protein [Curtobacterium sp. YC1]
MLPVVIPLSAAFFLVLLCILHARHGVTLPRASVAAALAVYAGGILANTVFPIYLDSPGSDEPQPLPLNLVPVVGYEVRDAVTNALVFLPLGILVPLLLARPTWWRVLAITAGASLGIEVVQFLAAGLAAGGHIADVNDWLSNIVGGLVGYGCFTLARRQPTLAALSDRFRWPSRARDHSGARSRDAAPIR